MVYLLCGLLKVERGGQDLFFSQLRILRIYDSYGLSSIRRQLSVEPSMEDSELDAFRQEWRQEAEASAKRRQGGPPLPFLNVSTSPKAATSSIELTHNLEDLHLADASGSQTVGPVKPKTAMEFYQVAVVAEKEGRLNDGELTSSLSTPLISWIIRAFTFDSS